MKAYVEAYGRTLNFSESREIEEALSGLGWDLAKAPDEADLAVLVTCVVVDKTERAMVKRLKELSSAPRLIVTGCMATACREKAEAVAPKTEFSAPGDVGSVAALAGSGAKPGAVLVRPPGTYAIVPIATGCKGTCSYCITRLARGPLRSRSLVSTVANVRSAVSTGPREITELRFRIALELNEGWVGKSVRALATEPGKKGSTILRTEEYRQIVVPGEFELGSYHDVTDATPTYLIGERGCVP